MRSAATKQFGTFAESWKRIDYRHCWLALLLVTLGCALSLSPGQEITNSKTASRINKLAYFEDASGSKSFDEILKSQSAFVNTSEHNLNFGLTESVYWVWITLKQTEIPSSLLVDVNYPHLDKLDVYRVNEDIAFLDYELGDSVPFNTRPMKNRTFILPVHFGENRQYVDVLLRVESQGALQLPIVVMTKQEYLSKVRNEQLILGLYFGVLLGLLAYNFLLALALMEPVYAYYCAFATCQSLFQFTINGMAFEYLWPNWQQINIASIPFIASLSLLLSTRFTHLFLNITRENSPKLFKGFRIAEYIFLALALASLFADRTLIIQLVAIACSLAGVLMFATGVAVFIRGDHNAKFYMMAFSLLLLGVVLYATKTLGLIPETFFTAHAVQLGTAFEMVLLSYALADRFNRLRNENLRMQSEAKATLELHVEQRTSELNDTLHKLKKANNQLESINQRDPLTNLYNRRYFNNKLEKIWGAMAADAQPMSVLMIDIDHFKSINDNQGHLVGDEVIIRLADTIDALFKDTNCIAARFGGEEFVALLPDHGIDIAQTIAETLRKDVAALKFMTSVSSARNTNSSSLYSEQKDTGVFSITVSIGISAETHTPLSQVSGMHIVDQADQALYDAKQTGRNRCCVYQTSDNQVSKAA